MSGFRLFLILCLLSPVFELHPESFRTVIEGSVEISCENPAGNAVPIGIDGSILITLGAETRFLRGIEFEISAPQAWLAYRGSIVMSMYKNLNNQTASGTADLSGSRIAFEPLPAKLQNVYQIPVRPSHGLRTTPYVTVVPSGVTALDTFPILFRFMPVMKGMNGEFEKLSFNITVRPILSAEGAVRLIPRYPPQLRGKPFTVLIDDVMVENLSEQHILKEGEHHLVVLSDDYRNESRRFVVEKAKTIDLIVDLQDPTPLIIFEGPQNAKIFLNNVPVPNNREPITIEPGNHEAKFQVGDYTITKTINVARGKTYRVALAVDLTIQEQD